jgi:hypothetical protein
VSLNVLVGVVRTVTVVLTGGVVRTVVVSSTRAGDIPLVGVFLPAEIYEVSLLEPPIGTGVLRPAAVVVRDVIVGVKRTVVSLLASSALTGVTTGVGVLRLVTVCWSSAATVDCVLLVEGGGVFW